jgi:hypothetical protein
LALFSFKEDFPHVANETALAAVSLCIELEYSSFSCWYLCEDLCGFCNFSLHLISLVYLIIIFVPSPNHTETSENRVKCLFIATSTLKPTRKTQNKQIKHRNTNRTLDLS